MEKKKKTNKPALLVLGAIVILFAILVLLLSSVHSGTDTDTEEDSVPAEEAVEDYTIETEAVFAKYGNFKGYESVVNVISNSMQDSTEEEIKEEMFQYWFTLIRYGDYEDAYTFVATDIISLYGYDYGYDDFLADCKELLDTGSGDSLGLTAEILDLRTPVEVNNNMGVSELSMVMIYEPDDGTAIYRAMLLLDDYRIIPFDCISQPENEKYGVDEADSQLEQDTYYQAETEDQTEETTETGETEEASSQADMPQAEEAEETEEEN